MLLENVLIHLNKFRNDIMLAKVCLGFPANNIFIRDKFFETLFVSFFLYLINYQQ